jgi:hypothetical protein
MSEREEFEDWYKRFNNCDDKLSAEFGWMARAALKQEPVAWFYGNPVMGRQLVTTIHPSKLVNLPEDMTNKEFFIPLYAAPPDSEYIMKLASEHRDELEQRLKEAEDRIFELESQREVDSEGIAMLLTTNKENKHKLTAANEKVEKMRGAMLSVLCDPEGNPCFEGSDGDRQVIRDALALPTEGETK